MSRFGTGLALCVAIFVLQWFFSSYVSFHGLSPQFLLIATIEAAALWGPDAAMLSGFGLGLSWDAMSPGLFGGRALILTLVGYAVGRLRRPMNVLSLESQIFFAAAATVFYRVALGFLGLIFSGRFLWAGWIFFLLEPVYNALAAAVFYILILQPFLSSRSRMFS